MRVRAVYNALIHGLLPYFFYEKQRHYDCSYFTHLFINLRYAWRWMTGNEDQSDIDFELKNN